MKFQTVIPEDIYLKLLPLFTLMANVAEVDPTKWSLGRFLKRDYLKERFGEHYLEIIPALKWAIAHPEKDYLEFVLSHHRERFSNEDCIAIMKLFLRSFEHINDEGPDIIQHARPYKNIPGDLDRPPTPPNDWLKEYKAR